ncbi:MAG: MFS transporter, partial [Chloroflexi bacterium]|nr:MFS transporter [Chloroflexota bacterium]
LVLQLTNSAFDLGLVSALQFLPVLAFALFAGVLVDRFPKRRMLVITQSLSLVQAIVIAVLTISGQIQLWQIYVLALLLGVVSAFDTPSRQSFVMELVRRESVVNAVGLNSAQFNAGRLVGPAVGGLVIARWGVGVCFAVNAVSFFAVIVCLVLLRASEFHGQERRPERGRLGVELRQGVSFLLHTPDLVAVTIVLLGMGTFGYNVSTIIPLIAQGPLHTGPEGYGLLASSIGIGSLSGALLLASRGRASMGLLMITAAGACIFFGTVAFSTWFALDFLLFVIVGGCLQSFQSSANSMMQLRAPNELRGRVMSVFTVVTLGFLPIGSLLTGWLAQTAGISFMIVLEGTLGLLAVGASWMYRSRRALAAAPAPESPEASATMPA